MMPISNSSEDSDSKSSKGHDDKDEPQVHTSFPDPLHSSFVGTSASETQTVPDLPIPDISVSGACLHTEQSNQSEIRDIGREQDATTFPDSSAFDDDKHFLDPNSPDVSSVSLSHECAICEKKFKSKKSLQRHVKVHGDISFECGECPKSFYDKNELKRHMNKHLGVRYHCSVCQKMFETKLGCSRHEKTHNKNFSYYCETCGKGFMYISDLKDHRSTHSSEKNYTCEKCNKHFKARSSCWRHLKDCQQTGQIKCEICGCQYKSLRYLQQHLKIHSSDKQSSFQCQTCGLIFRHKSSLYRHLKKSGHK